MDVDHLVEHQWHSIAHPGLEHVHLDAFLAHLLVRMADMAQVGHPGFLHHRQVSTVVHDAHGVGLGESHPQPVAELVVVRVRRRFIRDAHGVDPTVATGGGHTRTVTPAIKELEAAGVEFGAHTFEGESDLHDIGRVAAEQLGFDPDQVFKTLLVAVADDFVVAVVPVSTTLSLKAVAAAVGSKRVELADQADAERVTGYVRGGISPFGQRRRLPTLLDETAFEFDEIFVSGGRRGLDIGLAPADLVRVLDATVVDIGA